MAPGIHHHCEAAALPLVSAVKRRTTLDNRVGVLLCWGTLLLPESA
jgi:hypothetical protein